MNLSSVWATLQVWCQSRLARPCFKNNKRERKKINELHTAAFRPRGAKALSHLTEVIQSIEGLGSGPSAPLTITAEAPQFHVTLLCLARQARHVFQTLSQHVAERDQESGRFRCQVYGVHTGQGSERKDGPWQQGPHSLLPSLNRTEWAQLYPPKTGFGPGAPGQPIHSLVQTVRPGSSLLLWPSPLRGCLGETDGTLGQKTQPLQNQEELYLLLVVAL